LICTVILLIAAGLAAFTFSTEPTAQKGGASKKTAMLVEVIGVERANHRPRIVATGTVEPSQDIVLRPQISGRVTSLAPGFTPGGFVEAGEPLMQIERADFRHTLAQEKTALREALAALAIEKGAHDSAQAEYDFLDEDLAPENKALVLREPQLDTAEQRVAAARAAVEQAELNLRRTSVKAPFSAHIIDRNINVGSQVSPSESIARLVGVETYWVAVELPQSKLRWISVPEGNRSAGDATGEDSSKGIEGSEVRVRNRQAWPKDTFRNGHLFRLVGALDQNTRMAQVLAVIPDPLAREADDDQTPPLMIGEYVEVNISGVELEGVVRLDRDYVRDQDTVWTMEGGELQVKEVDVVLRDAEYAYIAGGLDDGAQVVTTNISTVVQGAPLRLQADEQSDEQAEDPATEEEASDE
jgi:RND family efflux transporter MFP subunit